MKTQESHEPKLNLSTIEAISFDCYGTLIDWEKGMRTCLESEGVLESIPEPWPEFVKRRLRREMELQAAPYRTYREILAHSLLQAMRELRMEADERTAIAFAESIKEWKPFPDVLTALRRIGSKWPMMVLSNVDRAVLMHTVARMSIPFAEVITAEDVRTYKPAPGHFEEAKKRLSQKAQKDGRLLHVAASLAHDVEPASKLGIQCVYVKRTADEPEIVELPSSPAGPTRVVDDLLGLCALLGI